jgi:hypothetical protein
MRPPFPAERQSDIQRLWVRSLPVMHIHFPVASMPLRLAARHLLSESRGCKKLFLRACGRLNQSSSSGNPFDAAIGFESEIAPTGAHGTNMFLLTTSEADTLVRMAAAVRPLDLGRTCMGGAGSTGSASSSSTVLCPSPGNMQNLLPLLKIDQ